MTIILIIEDEPTIRDMVQFALAPAGFTLLQAGDSRTAENCLAQSMPDLILLDWMLPDRSGIAFAKQLKKDKQSQHIPIIMLTAKAEEENKIKALEIGADDYITKPFSPRELIARIKTVLRRGPLVSPDDIVRVQGICLNLATHTLTLNDETIVLSPLEFKLLAFFMRHPERVYTRAQLLDFVWSKNPDVDERTVDVYIRRLRTRLKPFGYGPCIQTIRDSGYQFTAKQL